jgi:hypothetical protein
MASLSALESAVVLVAAAAAEGTPVVTIDLPDEFAATEQLLAASALLVGPRVTVISSVPRGAPVPHLGRAIITIDVDVLDSSVDSSDVNSSSVNSSSVNRREVLR